ncbi:MAG: TrbC/VirB2 family protein [bacterium]|nr:TrbC/VirB2 family protein [bacterium]
MKKTLLIVSVIIFFGLAPHVFAEGFVPLAPIPGLTDIQPTPDGLANFFNNLYKYLIGLAAALAVIMIIWGGLEIAVNKDNVSKILDAKGRIVQAVLGLVLVLSPVLVFSIINPSILNLSINLQKLDTASGPPTGPGSGTGGGAGSSTTDPATQCSVTGTSVILQIATCPSSAAATAWGQNYCTNGNLSTANVTNPTNGIITNVAICAGRQNYVFIDSGGFLTFTINRLQPLVRATNRPSNGSDAMSFASICRGVNLNLKTCVSDRPLFTFETPCGLTPEREWKCYEETLSCESGNFAAASIKCSSSPNWAPFQ